jgi:DNA-binding beta-propeller fold protein YncE
MKNCLFLSVVIFSIFIINACKQESGLSIKDNGYPADIEKIVIKKCANAGCHNLISHEAAAGLNLETWNNLFEGSRSGAVVIPYRPDFSTFCYYTNTDTFLGITLQPTMPYNSAPLSVTEYLTIKNWIQNGAPDNKGFVKFSDYQNKPKLYISNRGCDVVTVLDPESGLAMRYIDVGNSASVEGPCMIKVSPDKLYWYVIFNQGATLQKFRTADNFKVGELSIGSGFWSSVVITPDSKKAFITDTDVNGRIIYADLETMQLLSTYQAGLRYPFGMCINNSGNKLYVTSQEGNYIYKIDISNPLSPLIEEVSLEIGNPVSTIPTLNPYNILLNQDETMYYITCHKSAELRVVQTSNDSLLGVYATGSNPAEMIMSTDFPYVFISCLGVPGTNKLSVINLFDINSNVFLPEIYAGHDSKGIMIDESSAKLYVANRNVSAGGPAAHHEPVCDGKNGYITAINLNTLQLIPGYKAELSVDPYHISK